MPRGDNSGVIESLVSLLIAVIIIYVGIQILWPINPFLAIIFVLFALYFLLRTAGRGRL